MIAGGSQVQVTGGQNCIVVQLQSSQPFHRLKGVFSYDQLPIQFRVLFQNIQDFHNYLLQIASQGLRVQDKQLHVQVSVAGKIRQYVLPLEVLELTPEQQLKERIWILQEMVENKEKKIEKDRIYIESLKKKLQGQQSKITQLEKKVRERDGAVLQLKGELTHIKNLLHGQTSQTLKLKGYCRQLQNREDDQFQCEEEEKQREQVPTQLKKKGGATQTKKKPRPVKQIEQSLEKEQNKQASGKADKQTAQKQKQKPQKQKERVDKQYGKVLKEQDFGTPFLLWPCKDSKYLSKFQIEGNGVVEKLHGPTYQLYNGEALPFEGRYYFDIRIILIKNNNIVVGVITEKCKDEQFSFKKMNCVCYNGYDGSICEEDRQKYVSFKPKEGNRIRTMVDLSCARVDWFIMEGSHSKVHIGTASIPTPMLKQPLFPYFELYWEGNKVRLN